eukprot:gene34266-42254_t
MYRENRKHLDIHISDAATLAQSLAAVELSATHESSAILDRFNPVSYAAIFGQYIH